MLFADFDTLHNIVPGRHFYQFYKSADDYLKVIQPFIKCGLKKGHACLWLVSEKIGVEAVIKALGATVPHLSHLIATKQLVVLPAEEWYLTDGRFDAAKAIQKALYHYQYSRQLGFRCLRITGDAGVVSAEDREAVQAYEKKCHEFIHKKAVIAVCAYPILACNLKHTRMVIHSHDDVMAGRL